MCRRSRRYARVSQKAVDTHYFTLGATDSSGKGHGFELEGLVKCQLTRAFNVRVGGRWWHYETNLNDPNSQLLEYKTDRFGVFVQGSMKFGGDSSGVIEVNIELIVAANALCTKLPYDTLNDKDLDAAVVGKRACRFFAATPEFYFNTICVNSSAVIGLEPPPIERTDVAAGREPVEFLSLAKRASIWAVCAFDC